MHPAVMTQLVMQKRILGESLWTRLGSLRRAQAGSNPMHSPTKWRELGAQLLGKDI